MESLRNKIKNMKGITLISLIITIIVLLILAGVVINMTLGNDGIISKAQGAVDRYKNAQEKEEYALAKVENIVYGNRDIDKTELKKILKDIIKEEHIDTIPPGTIIAYAADKVPEGEYLKCEGQEVSRTQYKDLFDAIGTTYGAGDGSTTFNVPDLRGEFLRGSGTNSHVNEKLNITEGSGDSVGTHQDATVERGTAINIVGAGWLRIGSKIDTSGNSSASNADSSKKSGSWDVTLTPGWDESGNKAELYTSRPTNTSVLYCIKY